MGKAKLASESLTNKYIYIKVKLITSEGTALSENFDIINIKELIIKLIGERFGQVGKSLPIDLLKYDQLTKEAILRCSDESFNRLSSSLLFCYKFHDVTCHFQILKASHCSLGLVADSRRYSHRPSRNSNQLQNKKRKLE